MKLKQIYILLIFICLAINSFSLLAQTYQETWDAAEKYREEKNDQAAYALLKRLYFFSDSSMKRTCEEKLAYAAFYSGRYQIAAGHFGNLSKNADSSQYREFEILKLSSIFNAGQWQEVIQLTDSTGVQESDPILLSNLLYLRFLSQIMMNQKEEAIQTGLAFRKKIQGGETKKFDSLLLVYSGHAGPNPKTASRLSLLIPGLGQLYSKDKKNALNAFVLNETLIGAYIFTSLRTAWPESTLFWFFFLPHYYLGNARSAKEIALNKNEYLKKYYCTHFQEYGKTFLLADK